MQVQVPGVRQHGTERKNVAGYIIRLAGFPRPGLRLSWPGLVESILGIKYGLVEMLVGLDTGVTRFGRARLELDF